MTAGVRKLKNKRGCYDRYVVIVDGKEVAAYKINPKDREFEGARVKAQDHARRINTNGGGR